MRVSENLGVGVLHSGVLISMKTTVGEIMPLVAYLNCTRSGEFVEIK